MPKKSENLEPKSKKMKMNDSFMNWEPATQVLSVFALGKAPPKKKTKKMAKRPKQAKTNKNGNVIMNGGKRRSTRRRSMRKRMTRRR